MNSLLKDFFQPFTDIDSQIKFKNFSQVLKWEILEEDNKLFLKAELPGYQEDNVKVELNNSSRTITISGSVKDENTSDGMFSSSIKSFYKTFDLPTGTIVDEISAEMKKGILVVTLPRNQEKSANRVIEVKKS